MGTYGQAYLYDKDSFLVRVATLYVALQKDVPKTLQAAMRLRSHYSLISGHPGAKSMYETMRTQMYWPQMEDKAYETVKYNR